MSEWEKFRLGDITDWSSGGTPSKQKQEYWNGTIPWISARTLKNIKISYSEINITELGLKNGSRLAKKNDLLILVRGSGLFNSIPISIVEQPVAFNQDIKAISIREAFNWISPWYLLFWFHSNTRLLNGIMDVTGIGAGKFDTGILQNLTIEIPPIHILNEITRTVRAFYDKIELLQAQNITLEETVQTIFVEWFGKYQIGDELPAGWIESDLENLFDFKEGPGIRNWQYTETGNRFINIRLIQNGDLIVEKANFVSIEEANGKYSHFQLKEKDFVLSTSGTLGKGAIVRSEHLPLLLNTSVIRFRPKDFFSYGFMYQYLQSKYFLNELQSLASGSVQLNFGPIHLKQIKLIEPPQNDLLKFSKLVNPMYEKIIKNYSQIKTLTKTRDELLPRLMSGEVRVKM